MEECLPVAFSRCHRERRSDDREFIYTRIYFRVYLVIQLRGYENIGIIREIMARGKTMRLVSIDEAIVS